MPLRWKELMGVKEIDNNLVRIKDKKKKRDYGREKDMAMNAIF